MRFLLFILLVCGGLLPAAETIPGFAPTSANDPPEIRPEKDRYYVVEYPVRRTVAEWVTEEEERKNPEEAKKRSNDFLTAGGVTFPPPNFAMYSRTTETLVVKDTAAGHAKFVAKIEGWKKAYEDHLKAEKAEKSKKPTPETAKPLKQPAPRK